MERKRPSRTGPGPRCSASPSPFPCPPGAPTTYPPRPRTAGYATVVVSKPDGVKRAIFYRMGIAIGADASEADPGEFSAARENDLYFIRVGHERYEIPDAVVLGG